MKNISGEEFEVLINKGNFHIKEMDFFEHPIDLFTFKRNKELDIIFHIKSDKCKVNYNVKNNAGKRDVVKNILILKNKKDDTITAKNIAIQMQGIRQPITFNCIVQDLTYEAHTIKETKYLIEWITNIKDDVNFQPHYDENSYLRTVLEFQFKKHEIILGMIREPGDFKKFSPGFILYKENLDQETRNKLRLAISFALGRPLIYLGHASYDDKNRINTLKAISPYTYDELAFNMNTEPLTILNGNEESVFSGYRYHANYFSEMVTAIYDKFKYKDLEHISRMYWQSCVYSPYISAGFFSASIESFVNMFWVNEKQPISEDLYQKLESFIKELSVDNYKNLDEKNNIDEKLINSLKQANEFSIKYKIKKFTQSLNVEFNDKELKVWEYRNKIFHGKVIKDEEFYKLFDASLLLKVLFNRIFLAFLQTNKYYIDYYASGYPIKRLGDSIIK